MRTRLRLGTMAVGAGLVLALTAGVGHADTPSPTPSATASPSDTATPAASPTPTDTSSATAPKPTSTPEARQREAEQALGLTLTVRSTYGTIVLVRHRLVRLQRLGLRARRRHLIQAYYRRRHRQLARADQRPDRGRRVPRPPSSWTAGTPSPSWPPAVVRRARRMRLATGHGHGPATPTSSSTSRWPRSTRSRIPGCSGSIVPSRSGVSDDIEGAAGDGHTSSRSPRPGRMRPVATPRTSAMVAAAWRGTASGRPTGCRT